MKIKNDKQYDAVWALMSDLELIAEGYEKMDYVPKCLPAYIRNKAMRIENARKNVNRLAKDLSVELGIAFDDYCSDEEWHEKH